jgi:hypothetical protein
MGRLGRAAARFGGLCTIATVVGMTLAVGCRPDADNSNANASPSLGKREPFTSLTLTKQPRAQATIGQIDQPSVVLPHQDRFVLLVPGSVPRNVIRYSLATDARTYTLATKLTSRHLEKGAFTAAADLPVMREGFAITVTGGSPRLAVRALPSEVVGTATPETTDYLALWDREIANRRLGVELDPRGALGPVAFADDAASSSSKVAIEEVTQRLLGLVIPLPAPAIGVGAKWQVVTLLHHGPFTIKQTAVYTLESRTDKKCVIAVVIRREAHDQAIDDPRVRDGATTSLVALFRLIAGTVTLDLTRPLPAAAELSLESRLHVRMTSADGAPSEDVTEDIGSLRLETAGRE